MNRLLGIHAVREALVSRQPLDRIVIARGRHGDRIDEIVTLARTLGIQVRFEDRLQLDRLAGSRDHQGVIAFAAARQSFALEDLIERGKARADGKPLLVLLDSIEDPHNLGAIIRSALASGADGTVIPERRAVGLTEVVARASAGALEHLPVARVNNLSRAMQTLKEAGYWLIGLDERAEKNYTEADYNSPLGIVLGSEGKGLHELVRKNCDFLVSIPTTGPVRSLNASVAAGIVLFEAVRQRRKAMV